ncbi:ribonuclease H-like domain-containing protein [Tanacetum coccineum]
MTGSDPSGVSNCNNNTTNELLTTLLGLLGTMRITGPSYGQIYYPVTTLQAQLFNPFAPPLASQVNPPPSFSYKLAQPTTPAQQVQSGSPGSTVTTRQAIILHLAFTVGTLHDLASGAWNFDTGASSHLNNSVNSLSEIFNTCMYPSVSVGDGHSIPVTNTGHSIFPTLTRSFHLNNVLITPHIVKNLIFVRQFVRDNNCTIEFDAFGFSVKDFLTRRVLLRCDSTGDLYPVTAPSHIPHAFLVSQHTWHQHLGHPGGEVLRRLVYSNFISCNKEKPPVLCHACQLGKHVRLLFVSSGTVISSCFDIIHSDVWTSSILSLSGTNRPTKRLNLHVSSVSPLPKSYRDAFNDLNWQNSMRDEYTALIKNKTWTLVPRPPDTNIMRCTIRTVLSLAASRHWSIHQLDVKNAFLHGDLTKTVYMHQPPGFQDSTHLDYVCLLQRSLYGLKQAPRSWFQRFFFRIVTEDYSLFVSGKYAIEILEKAHMLNCNPSLTPVDTESKLGVGVQQVFLHMHDPREPHLSALKRILWYVQGTLNYGLQLFSSSTTNLVAYSDADWAGCPTT